MNNILRYLLRLPVEALLLSLLVTSTACAGVPLEVGLFKSTLLTLQKKIVLVTLANTKKEAKEKNADILAKSDKIDLERKSTQDSDAANTNKFVTLEVLSPYVLKLDGITIGRTSMIVWTQGDDDAKPVSTFYDIKVIETENVFTKRNEVTGESYIISIEDIKSKILELTNEDGIEVSFADDTIILSGAVKQEINSKKAEHIANSFANKSVEEKTETEIGGAITRNIKYKDKVKNYLKIDDPKQVLLQVKVAQVDKSSLKKLGISYMIKGSTGEGFVNMIGAPTGGSTLTSTSSGNGFSSSMIGEGIGISGDVVGLGSFNPLDAYQIGIAHFPSGIGAVIQALATKGYAKILAEPNLMVRSGQEGNFLAGSKIPYNVVTSIGGTATTSIVFEEVGIKLKFKPEVLENGLINLKIDPAEVSSISGTLQVNGYPVIDTREVRTSVELKEGESLVLAGLLQEEQIRTMSKIPLLGDIPILGALFRSTQNDLKEKELVFFITPSIVKPKSPGTKTELPTDKKLSPEQERELEWIPLGD